VPAVPTAWVRNPLNGHFTLIPKATEMRMDMKIRVTTRADLFERRKQQHIERRYRIEEERPIPVNGLCSFIAVREQSDSDPFGELVAQAIHQTGNGVGR